MSWAGIKQNAQRQVHKAFAVRCLYRETKTGAAQVVFARLHSKEVFGGNSIGGKDYAQIVEDVSKVVFSREELLRVSLVPKRNGFVTFPDYNLTYQLDVRDPDSGLINERWTLADPT